MVQWYPGHMVKAKEEMKVKAQLVDAIIVLLDARAPYSSLNPDLNSMFGQKPLVFVLNKADLADPKLTPLWEQELKKQSYSVFSIETLKKPPIDMITKRVKEACHSVLEKEKAKGMKERPLKAMIVGIPNVGKSTLINRIAGKNVARVANRPGVTTSAQWIRLNKELYVLDMPGVLWPKFDDEQIGLHLGLIGSIKDQTNSYQVLVPELLNIMVNRYPGYLKARYDIEESSDFEAMLDAIAVKKGFNNPRDARQRTYTLLLADYRNDRLGQMTLDTIEH